MSSKGSIWPIFLEVNELPPDIRMSNLLLGGLWFSDEQPPMDLFLAPFVDHIRTLSQGFNLKVGDVIRETRVYAVLTLGHGVKFKELSHILVSSPASGASLEENG